PAYSVDSSEQDQDETHHNDPARPDVGGEVQRIGLERLAVILGGDLAQGAGAPEIYRHGDEHHGKSGDAGLDVDMMKEQAFGSFVDDPDAGEQQKAGLDESGEVFHLAVSVLVIGVGRLVRDADRHQRNDRRDEIKNRVQGFGEYAQAAGGYAHCNFQSGNGESGQNGVSGNGTLFGAHGLRT